MKKKKPLLTVPGDTRAGERLLGRVRAALATHRAADAEYASHWKQRIAQRPTGMTRFEYGRFILWHRQFRGLTTPGLPFLVGTARQAARRLRPALDILPALVRLVRSPS